jgi:putative transposase
MLCSCRRTATQQRTVRSTSLEVARRCREAQLHAPNGNTIQVRIAAIPDRERLGRRSHRKAAVDQFAPRPGVFDSAQRPLDLVQIDHTKLDIIVVDDEQRLPIGRPWITLAIDVYSRMVAGFYVSLDPPGAIATGLCIAHATLPKEAWLAKLGGGGQWPCWGLAPGVRAIRHRARVPAGSATAHGWSYRATAGNAHGRAA